MDEVDPRPFYNVHDAKTNLSRLIDHAHAGEEIVLAKAGKPYARLVPYEAPVRPKRQPGGWPAAKGIPDSVWSIRYRRTSLRRGKANTRTSSDVPRRRLAGLLLDTHAALWWWADPERLTPRAADVIASTNDPIHVSVVSGLEMAIKYRIGSCRTSAIHPKPIPA